MSCRNAFQQFTLTKVIDEHFRKSCEIQITQLRREVKIPTNVHCIEAFIATNDTI